MLPFGVNGLPALAGRHTGHDVRAAGEHPAGVLGAFRAGDPLNQDPGVLVEENRHVRLLVPRLGDPAGRIVHGVDHFDQVMCGVIEDLATDLGVVAVQPHDERLVGSPRGRPASPVPG